MYEGQLDREEGSVIELGTVEVVSNRERVIAKPISNAEDAEVFAKGAEKGSPLRTSATASAPSAFMKSLR